jgi:predicted  nucleic acid-binding Zn-ribbon protein
MGEEEANALLSEFPAAEHDELVTKGHLRAELAEVRVEIADLRTDTRTDIADLRTEMRTEFAEVRTEIAGLRTENRTDIAGLRTENRTDVADLRTEMRTEFAEIRTEIAGLHTEIAHSANRTLVATSGMLIAGVGVAAAIGRALGT